MRGEGFEPSKPSPSQSYGERLIEEEASTVYESRSFNDIGDTPPKYEVSDIEEEIERFRQFLRLKKNLSRKTVKGHSSKIWRFLSSYHGVVTDKTVEDYLSRVKRKLKPKTYANYLCSFKRYIRDFKDLNIVDEYEFPDIAGSLSRSIRPSSSSRPQAV